MERCTWTKIDLSSVQGTNKVDVRFMSTIFLLRCSTRWKESRRKNESKKGIGFAVLGEEIPDAYCREVVSSSVKNQAGEEKTTLLKNSCGIFAHQKQTARVMKDMQEEIQRILLKKEEEE